MAEAWGELSERVARAVRDLRIARGLSQGDLARDTRLSKRRIQQIEGGDLNANPSLRVLHRLAVALGVDVADLVTEGAVAVTDRQRVAKGAKSTKPAPSSP